MSQHVMPFADYRPIAWAEARDDDTNPTCVVLHLTASEATSQYAYFSNPANKACSNAHVARSGYIEQYIRGDRLSAADAYGSHRSFSIETQGADASGRWTAEQCESIAHTLAWAHHTYDIPLRLMTSSAATERGVGWHRLGIDGNFPSMPNILAGRLQRGGGEHWSSAFGKVCPGDNRIKQIPDIITRAQAIVAGAATQEDDMSAAAERQIDDLHRLLLRKFADGDHSIDIVEGVRRDLIVDRRIEADVNTLVAANRAQAATMKVQAAAIETLSKSVGVDPALIVAAVERSTLEAVREALPASVTIPLEG